MRTGGVVAISLVMACAGYLARMTQEAPGEMAKADPSPTPSPAIKVYQLAEVQARRQELEDKIITVTGAVCIWPGGRPFLIPDDEESLLAEPPGTGRYGLSMPAWRFRDLAGIHPRCSVTGRFGRLDDNLGFDSLSPIQAVSWKDGPSKGEQSPPPEP